MTIVRDHEHVAKRAEALEREGAKEMRLRAEARAVAGYEPGDVEESDGSDIIVADDGAAVATDGGESETDHAELREGEQRDNDNTHTAAIADEQFALADEAADRPLLDVGDQAIPTDREATVTVVRTTGKTAGEYVIDEIDETVAEYNDCDPGEDVYEVVFPDRTTKDINSLQRYPYPRSKLRLETPIHDRDGNGNGGDGQ
ncbi:hypothetical protein [Natrinema hispanicum]|uniref:Uncharacterized protein n=1 Tax=Natrinema hispanicum TaxID=392421 RepID=A0A1I0IVR0_9EURY|nr:hypothetical protein [Natrinema hispanicum]SEU01361.1 hypothetical protein SAMN04488694_12651 [Natrinema hispanicum]